MEQNDISNINKTKEEYVRDFLDLVPNALEALRDIIDDPNMNPLARVQAAAVVMDRGLGKPEETIKIQNMEADMDAAHERMDELFEELRRKRRGE